MVPKTSSTLNIRKPRSTKSTKAKKRERNVKRKRRAAQALTRTEQLKEGMTFAATASCPF